MCRRPPAMPSTTTTPDAFDPFALDDDPYGWASSFEDLTFKYRPAWTRRQHSRRWRARIRARHRRVGKPWGDPREWVSHHDWRGILTRPPRQTTCPDERFGMVRRDTTTGATYPWDPPCRKLRCECRIYDLVTWREQARRLIRSHNLVYVTRYRVCLAKGDESARLCRQRIAKNIRDRSKDEPSAFLRFTLYDGWEYVIATHDPTGRETPTWCFTTSGRAAADLAWWLCDRSLQRMPQGSGWVLDEAKKKAKRIALGHNLIVFLLGNSAPPKAETIGALPPRKKRRELLAQFVEEETGHRILKVTVLADDDVPDVRESIADQMDLIRAYGLGLDDDKDE